LNATIANTILAWWSPDQFDTTGLLRTAWLTRMTATSDDTHELIETLFASDARAADPSSSGVDDLSPRRHRFRG
jgi:hypothetical protein